MRFTDIPKKITGISCPIFGISWTPPKDEREIAKNILNFLEPRRVLFNPYNCEYSDHCVLSVIQIRNFLTEKLDSISDKSELDKIVRTMRKACNIFLNRLTFKEDRHNPDYQRISNLDLCLAELRSDFRRGIARICKAYGYDLEEDLAEMVYRYGRPND